MSRRKRLDLERSGPWIGVAGVVVVLWLAVSSFLYAPWWGVVLLVALVIPEAVLVARWARTRPTWCVGVPLVGTALFVLVSYLGAVHWGWSA